MNNSQKNPKLHFDQILLKLDEMNQRVTVPEKMDYFTLLEEMSAYYNLTAEELKTRGFRKAYRQAVEGL
ncbi:MAG: hypothetical protein QF649_07210 [SAR324 cluster bacterium]|jgi:hypothetical protein|nr:hypothetical protein [SAR324 cluster bacterium]MDP6331881.1 hypothetical protein [SAR324 cluster bacterium]MEC9360323.1 hypothetical protein [SAR324 cluster bacterium]RZO47029.1 MAG: hypothetical protein EVA81_02585 [Pseudomonadota bacterium]HAF88708.1 hypothetical protein [Deltaproteobacteria bacterium]|tara:strand:+ start:807 stop:1013 length:207 start_codon:yes stop_codon:yes gene_type:complete